MNPAPTYPPTKALSACGHAQARKRSYDPHGRAGRCGVKAVEITDLNFKYKDGTEALNGIILSIPKGEFVVITGKSGAGKSSLCLSLNGLIPKFLKGEFRGSVSVLNKDVKNNKVSELAKKVGVVFQDFDSQLFSTNVELEVAFTPENFNFSKKEIERRIESSLSLVGLSKYRDRNPALLSGGEKQLVAIASILSGSPEIIVMDEPTTDLDPAGKEKIFTITKELKKNHTLIFVEHETEEILNADRMLIMNGGKIVADGSPKDLLSDVELLEKNGVRPLDLCRLFKNEPVFSIKEGIDLFKKKRFSISDKLYENLKHKKSYGRPVLEIKDLTYSYGPQFSIEKISLTIRKGEFVAIVGQNGSGKTTFAKHLNGLLLPDRGEIKINGVDISQWKRTNLAREVGYVFQNPDHQLFAETVKDEVSFGPRNFGVPKEELELGVKESLQSVGLEGYETFDPFSLTKGERQKVAVASILASRPSILILDEPTTGLDYYETRSMMNLLTKLNRAGYTIIIITHSMWVVCEYSSRVVVMDSGRVVLDGKTREVFSKEDLLRSTKLKPPQITRFSRLLGKTFLSVEELKKCLN